MGFTKDSIYIVATLLPLYGGGVYKKEEIMEITEKNYLNTAHSDFNREILDGKSAGRKFEEWAIQKSFDKGYISRIKTGYYEITALGKCYIEDFSANIATEDMAEIAVPFTLFNDKALNKLDSIYRGNESDILVRQAANVRKLFPNL